MKAPQLYQQVLPLPGSLYRFRFIFFHKPPLNSLTAHTYRAECNVYINNAHINMFCTKSFTVEFSIVHRYSPHHTLLDPTVRSTDHGCRWRSHWSTHHRGLFYSNRPYRLVYSSHWTHNSNNEVIRSQQLTGFANAITRTPVTAFHNRTRNCYKSKGINHNLDSLYLS